MAALDQTLATLRAAVEGGLTKTLEEAKGTDIHFAGLANFHQAVAHAVLGGGKRVRPCLTLLCAQACGMKDPAHDPDALRAALAIELLHCYTLVHDDLPAMDNDTERRGRPSVWAKFGEANAILVGDYLQALSFKTLPTVSGKPLAAILAKGAVDVVSGQVADIAAAAAPSVCDAIHLLYVDSNKTGALFKAACGLGACVAGADEKTIEAFGSYGMNLGLAFQYVDDLLDADQAKDNAEPSILTLCGGDVKNARIIAEAATTEAINALMDTNADIEALVAFAESLLDRLA